MKRLRPKPHHLIDLVFVITILVLFAALHLATSGCSMLRSGSGKKNFAGQWAGDAQTSWNIVAGDLKARGIAVRSVTHLNTHYEQANGTMGGGHDRLPYKNVNGGRIGGWYTGTCGSGGDATVIREAGGWSNPNIKTHEVAHAVDAHARCEGGHPGYIRAPHWPHWRNGAYALHYQIDGSDVCLVVIEEAPEGLNALAEPDREAARRQFEAFARSLVAP